MLGISVQLLPKNSETFPGDILSIFTSRVNGRGYKNGAVCVCVCVCQFVIPGQISHMRMRKIMEYAHEHKQVCTRKVQQYLSVFFQNDSMPIGLLYTGKFWSLTKAIELPHFIFSVHLRKNGYHLALCQFSHSFHHK